MDVLVFSDSRSAPKWFAGALRSRTYNVEFRPAGAVRDEVPHVSPGTMIYVDLAGQDGSLKALYQYLARNEQIRFGFLDPRARSRTSRSFSSSAPPTT